MKGIYKICILDKCYVGKDSSIHKNNRLTNHLRDLNNNRHWNKELQEDYNKFGEDNLTYSVLESHENITEDEIYEREKYYIKLLNTYNEGYNKTLGGVGGSGIIFSEEHLRYRSESRTGELNPHSKLTNKQFFEIIELFKEGKSNREIADLYGLHDRYVSLIRHKKRFKNLFKFVKGYTPEKSDDQRRGLNYEQFTEVVALLKQGWTNADIQRKFGLSSGTGSRIRNKKLYKRYWEKYEQENK